MRHLGILAHSAEGAALCFRTFCQTGFEELGPHQHPDVTMDCIAMSRSMTAWDAGDYETINAIFGTSVSRLAAAGADFFVCPDNTAHIAMEQSDVRFDLPGLHIGEVVADAAQRAGYRRIGILGTKYTMEGPVYPRALGARGMSFATPDSDDRAMINAVIFDELVNGIFTDAARDRFVQVIRKLSTDGCDAVALVCTEIPLLVTADVSPLPILDSTRLQARAAFDVAAGRSTLPSWRGGPVAREASQLTR